MASFKLRDVNPMIFSLQSVEITGDINTGLHLMCYSF